MSDKDYPSVEEQRIKMRLTIIDEVGLRTKDGKKIVAGLNIQQIEIPDEILIEFKTAYDLWLEEQTKKKELKK